MGVDILGVMPPDEYLKRYITKDVSPEPMVIDDKFSSTEKAIEQLAIARGCELTRFERHDAENGTYTFVAEVVLPGTDAVKETEMLQLLNRIPGGKVKMSNDLGERRIATLTASFTVAK
jgi:hypothetical protein